MIDLTQEKEDAETREINEDLCERGWPASLIRATSEPMWYALGLRNGSVVHFEAAELLDNATFVRLIHFGNYLPKGTPILSTSPSMTFEMGIEVCVADIMWAAEMPYTIEDDDAGVVDAESAAAKANAR